MPEIIKETVVTKVGSNNTVAAAPVVEASTNQTIEYLIYFFLGLLETLLAFRLVLKLMGASTASGFVRFVYNITGVFLYPFEGIFHRAFTEGIETTSILEPSTIIAMIVYALLVWGIVVLLRVLSGEQQPTN